MNVEGTEIPDHLIEHALLGLNAKSGFTFAEFQSALVRVGVGKYPAYRCADRSLQKMRKAGTVFFSNKKWWPKDVAQ